MSAMNMVSARREIRQNTPRIGNEPFGFLPETRILFKMNIIRQRIHSHIVQ